jgi:adenylylsulfate kinase
MEEGFTLWLTGLSGSGKTTIAEMMERELRSRGIKVERLDGEEIRAHLKETLGFTRRDREIHLRYLAFICGLLNRNGIVAVVGAISPYRDLREMVRNLLYKYVEIYCQCPLDVLQVRDTKGGYRRAVSGKIDYFTGISDPYEEPEQPEVILRTHLETPAESVGILLKFLENSGLVPVPPSPPGDYSEEEEQIIAERLKNFGY